MRDVAIGRTRTIAGRGQLQGQEQGPGLGLVPRYLGGQGGG